MQQKSILILTLAVIVTLAAVPIAINAESEFNLQIQIGQEFKYASRLKNERCLSLGV